MGSFGEFFLFYRLTEFNLCVSLWLEGIEFLFLSKILSAFFTRNLAQDSPPSVHVDLCSKTPFHPECGLRLRSPRPLFQNWISYSLFLQTEEGGYFRIGIQANHLASIFFLPLSGDSLGLQYVPVPLLYPSGHRVQTSVGFHSDLDLLLEELT